MNTCVPIGHRFLFDVFISFVDIDLPTIGCYRFNSVYFAVKIKFRGITYKARACVYIAVKCTFPAVKLKIFCTAAGEKCVWGNFFDFIGSTFPFTDEPKIFCTEKSFTITVTGIVKIIPITKCPGRRHRISVFIHHQAVFLI